ncbi:MAG: hypothetical protein HGA69_00820 [Desulfobulbaceae bacterium]|nr:hypothetical protein [Desulfobulbaceae bacterium]
MTHNSDFNLYSQAKSAVATLMRHYRYGAYRVIRDPEGVVSLWAIEGSPHAPFSITFVDKGRVYNRIEDVPDSVLKSFLEYVRKTVR